MPNQRTCQVCGRENDAFVNPRRCYACGAAWDERPTTEYHIHENGREWQTFSADVAEIHSRLGATVTATTL